MIVTMLIAEAVLNYKTMGKHDFNVFVGHCGVILLFVNQCIQGFKFAQATVPASESVAQLILIFSCLHFYCFRFDPSTCKFSMVMMDIVA